MDQSSKTLMFILAIIFDHSHVYIPSLETVYPQDDCCGTFIVQKIEILYRSQCSEASDYSLRLNGNQLETLL